MFHPQVDPRFEGDARVRYVYMSYCNDDGVSGSPPIGWMRWDPTTGEARTWVAPPGCFCEEVVVIPKARGGGGGGGEDRAARDATVDASQMSAPRGATRRRGGSARRCPT